MILVVPGWLHNSNSFTPDSKFAYNFTAIFPFFTLSFNQCLRMKKIILLFIVAAISLSVPAQYITDSVHPLFKGEINGDLIRDQFSFSSNKINTGKTKIIIGVFIQHKLAIRKQFADEKIKTLQDFKTDTTGVYEIPANGYNGKIGLPVFDSSGIIITVNGINKQNAGEYEFRVLENRTKEVVSWHPVTLFSNAYTLSYKPDGSEENEVAYLGEFKTILGNSLTIEVRKKNDPVILGSVSAVWINRSPSVLGVFSNNEMTSFLTVFKNQWQQDGIYEITAAERNAKDSLLQLRSSFGATENNLIFYLDDKIKSKEIIEYNLVNASKSTGWKINDFDLNLVWLKNLAPGNYRLQLRYSLQRHNVSEYTFTIAAAWHQTLAFKIIAGTIGMIALCFFYILFISAKQKQKIKQEQLQKQLVQTEIKSIRSQFNPHFVFNALGSIQGLITKNDMEGANQYLTAFSSLLRDSLKASSQEFVSIATETKMLDTYLTLEKLRFGFKYTITVDENINATAIEVPALLLQPIAENAVKHGIASLYEKGELAISFSSAGNDLAVTVADNGKGFITTKATEGFGVKMTKDRIQLLNTTLQGQRIEFDLQSSDTGTTVHLLFKNWLV